MRGSIHPPILERSVRRVLAAQALLAILLAAATVLATAVLSDSTSTAAAAALSLARAQAVAFGALLGILATVITARSVIKSSQAATEHIHVESNASARIGMLPLYSGLLFKLLLVAGGAFVGLVYLQLGPLYIALGYIAMQAGYLWAAVDHNRAANR